MAEPLSALLSLEFGGNVFQDYLAAVVAFVVALVVLRIVKFVVIHRLKALAKKTKSELDDVLIAFIDSLGWPFYLVLSLYTGLKFVSVPALLEQGVYFALLIAGVYYISRGVHEALTFAGKAVAKRKGKEGLEEADTTMIDLFRKIIKGLIWLAAFILVLNGLGIDLSGVVVGLGVTGIVIGFALQNVLNDIFASFSIYFDKPFRKGDFIIIGDDLGTVKKIGIKSTRIATLQGEELVVSNRELTETRVHNYKRMRKRRIAFTVGVTYGTPSSKMKKIPQVIKEIIKKVDLAEPDRVHFKSFGDFSLNFEIVYYLNSPDYNVYMDVQQEINLAIKEKFEKMGVEIAFPTQTIFLEK